MVPHKKFFVIISIFLLDISCTSPATTDEEERDSIATHTFKQEKTEVSLSDVSTGIFNIELICNGKSLAIENAEIKFPVNTLIKSILIKNGDHVKNGQLLATLDDSDLKTKLSRSKESLEKATVELDDRLIDYGYRLKDSLKVPVETMRMVRLKSGYNTARYDYADLQLSLKKTFIRAPFSGKIADLEARVYNTPDGFKRLCTLIDDSRMLIEFNVLETEFRFLSKGSPIEVSPFGGGASLKGTVTQVNPQIDMNGMIKIIGMVDNGAGNLLNGMSVRVIVRRTVQNKLYIPKEALVERDGKEVVFTYENGKAKWNYVETGLRNSRSVCITSGLQKGQQVIISNTVNLAHDSEVIPVNSNSSGL